MSALGAAARATRLRTRRDAVALVSSFAVVLVVAAVGGAATDASVGTWYDGLDKPAWTPPGAFIGAVWTFLYAFMAVAAWLVWRSRNRARGVALGIYGTQLALNALWSWLFFGLQRPWLAFGEILVLAVAVAATIAAFVRVSRVAAALLAPYLAWVIVAATLNFLIAVANP